MELCSQVCILGINLLEKSLQNYFYTTCNSLRTFVLSLDYYYFFPMLFYVTIAFLFLINVWLSYWVFALLISFGALQLIFPPSSKRKRLILICSLLHSLVNHFLSSSFLTFLLCHLIILTTTCPNIIQVQSFFLSLFFFWKCLGFFFLLKFTSLFISILIKISYLNEASHLLF